jgi:hypothetical protein
MESRILELVVFRLAAGVSREEFLGTVEAVSSWISAQPGFISRELCHDADGDRWIDVLWWRTMSDAQAAAELAMSSASCAPMFGLIDLESTLMVHGKPAVGPVVSGPTAVGT